MILGMLACHCHQHKSYRIREDQQARQINEMKT